MTESLGYQRQYSIQESANGRLRFENESVLEDFVWDNLSVLFKATPLRRQHHVNGNYCDILAVGEKRNLIIIELKNDEDRYVVQQITRYYHQLIQEKPYQNEIDYQQPIELLIVSPSFHDDNLTDRLYHKLKIDLVQFQLINENGDILFKTNDLDQEYAIEAKVLRHTPKPIHAETIIQIPPVPRSLNTALAKCKKIDPDLVFFAREKILRFDSQIQEIKINSGDFIYGKGKSKPCSQITVKREVENGDAKHRLHFGLWLPVSLYSPSSLNSRVSRIIGDGLCRHSNVDSMAFLLHQRGIGRTQKTTSSWDSKQYLLLFLCKALNEEFDWSNFDSYLERYCDVKGYKNPTHGNLEYLDFFVSVALDLWKERLESKSK